MQYVLQRLKTEYLDVLLLHRPDALVEPEEVAEAFDILEKSGKVRNFGVSNMVADGMEVNILKKREITMQNIFEITQSDKVASLFEGWQETLIWSCLQKVMGHLYADELETPTSAMAILGDFCFLAGEANREFVLYKPEWCKQDFMIMVPQNEAWADMIEKCYGKKAKKVTRYAIKKEPDVFDREMLQTVVDTLPDAYTMKIMDEELFWRCKEISWCRDWVSQYDNYEMYRNDGLGVVILKDGEPVSGASSYSGYRGGIEIEIDTREDYRRKGLAYACGAKLILECLKRVWYPSWDAQNKWSVALAEKLGYHFDHEYVAYEIWEYGKEN